MPGRRHPQTALLSSLLAHGDGRWAGLTTALARLLAAGAQRGNRAHDLRLTNCGSGSVVSRVCVATFSELVREVASDRNVVRIGRPRQHLVFRNSTLPAPDQGDRVRT